MAHRDVVWVTLESTRYDRTSMAGHDRDTTPFLRRLASEANAASFSHCVAHAIWTRPSSASILTGRAPSNHRVWSTDATLPEGVPTIPEQLRDAGYRTVAVSPNAQLSAATGLDRGFESFHYLGKRRLLEEAGLRTLLGYALNVRRHSAGLTTDTRKHCIGYISAALSRRYIRQAGRDDRPLFLYVHLGDSHHPYYPPKAWRDRFADDLVLPTERALAEALEASDRFHEHIASGVDFDTETWNALSVLYDTVLSYVDSLAGSIVESAREHLDDPVIVVTADHGELLGEQGLLAHMLVTHTAVTDVPLVIAGVDVPPERTRDLVQHADAMATIGADLGLDVDVPLGRDLTSESRSMAVTQRGGERARKKLERIREHNPAFDAEAIPSGDLTSVRTLEYRYQRSDDGADLFALPDESEDVSSERPEVARRLAERLDEWLDASGRPAERADRTADFSPEMRRQLEDLGYL